MAMLKNPQQQIPGGFVFFQPETRWSPAPFSSLDSITAQLMAHRQGRPDLVQKHHWPTAREQVYAEVMAFNIAHCQRMNWRDYLLGADENAVPFPQRTLNPLQKLKNVAAGAEVLIEWIESGAEAVTSELANNRAQTCSTCPENKSGGWESWFTVPASNAIRKTMERRKDMKLETPFDDKLHVCSVCLCPLALKVHLKLEQILKNLPKETKGRLPPHCWIVTEDK